MHKTHSRYGGKSGMKKITLKLKQFELEYIINQTEHVLANAGAYGYSKSHEDRLILAALGEFYDKIHGLHSPFVKDYKLKIQVSQAMAFLIHFHALPGSEILSAEQLCIQTLIGKIDQQTT